MLIRLRGCAGWSATLLFARNKIRFSHDEAHIYPRVTIEAILFCCSLLQTESPLYYTVMALHIMSADKWKTQRVKFLERLLVLAHIRNTVAIGGTRFVYFHPIAR